MSKRIITGILLLMLALSVGFAWGCKTPSTGTNEFTVTFDGNGGVQVQTDTVSLQQTVNNSSELKIPTFEKDGYQFNGWDLDISGIKTDSVVKAQWLKIYTITYVAAEFDSDNVKTRLVITDADFTLATPKKTGYEFLGWTGNGVTTPTKIVTVKPSQITDDLTFTAHWSKTSESIEIRLSNQYYLSSENKTITYTINGKNSFVVAKDSSFNSLNVQNPTIENKLANDYFFSHWAYKNSFGKYVSIKDAKVTAEIATNGVIVLYPVTCSFWVRG